MSLCRKAAILLILLSYGKMGIAQLVVDTNYTTTQLVQKVLLGGNLVAYNIKYTGAHRAIAYFDGTNSNIGLKNGVLMTTGSAENAIGPNNLANQGEVNNTPGDTALTRICGDTTYDACILQFDFVPYADTVSFDFVFGSQEYPRFTCCRVNDVFAFFISGPGIVGYKNIALVPSTLIPISINTLNGNCNATSDCGGGCCNSNSEYYIDNTGGQTIQYTGFTTVMKALSKVECGKEYHIRIAIANGGDQHYDSGVFLGGRSFVGGTQSLQIAYAPTDSICPNSNVTISFPDGNPSHIFHWSFGDGNVVSGTGNGPYLVNWATAGQKQVMLSVSGPCAYDIDSVYINIASCDVIIPNVFTPGTGDKNSVFYITELEKYPHSNLTLYNRWGQIIYSTGNYENNWNGDNQPDGTYFYLLTLPTGESKKGFVTLIRK